MATRRSSAPENVSEIAWKYLHDIPVIDDGFELTVLEADQYDHANGYRLSDLWARYGPEIVDAWIERHPGTRPWCWWRFESGLPYVYRPDPARPFEIIEDQRKLPMRALFYGDDPTKREVQTDVQQAARLGRLAMDQRAWLQERGFLQDGE